MDAKCSFNQFPHQVDNDKLKRELSAVTQQLRALQSPGRRSVDERQSPDSLLDKSLSKDR